MRTSRPSSPPPRPSRPPELTSSGILRAPLALLAGRGSAPPPAPEAPREPGAAHQRWEDICGQADLRGRWVALDDCAYDGAGDRPSWGVVVDADEDLAALCARLRAANWKSCAVHFADGEAASHSA